MAMDFIRSCTTNVQILEGALKLPYQKYRLKEADNAQSIFEKELASRRAVKHLREYSVLAATHGSDVWVFDTDGDRTSKALEWLDNALNRFESGIVEEDEAATDRLLAAIEGGISYSLANGHGVYRIGDWLWAFPTSSELGGERGTTALRIYTHITADGALQFTTLAEENTGCAADLHPGSCREDLILSPSGRKAQLVESNNLPKAVRDEHWRVAVCERLQFEGINVDQDVEWLPVVLSEHGRSVHAVWPAPLCFSSGPTKEKTKSDQSWTKWFAQPDTGTGYRNPLVDAEQWLSGAATLNSASTIPSAPAERQEMAPVGNRAGLGADLGISPPFMQRMEQQSVNGIYPTPPDGMAPVPSSQQPNQEADVPIPTQESKETSTDSITTANHDPTEDAMIPENVHSNPPLKEDREFSLASSSGDVNAVQAGHDELFGDVEGMDFGGEEVGDADFSFFDEPDAVSAVPVTKRSTDAEMVDLTPDVAKPRELQNQDDMEQMHGVTVDSLLAKKEHLHESPMNEVTRDASDASPEVDAAGTNPTGTLVKTATSEFEAPLSPFSIRERILPPPIPASAKQQDPEPPPSSMRRASSFAPVNFNDAYHFPSRYVNQKLELDVGSPPAVPYQPSISLPPKRKKSATEQWFSYNQAVSPHAQKHHVDSENDSDESDGSESETELPPIMPWESKKRRRNMQDEAFTPMESPILEEIIEQDSGHDIRQESRQLLDRLMSKEQSDNIRATNTDPSSSALAHAAISIGRSFQFSGADIIGIAQLISEQSVTTTSNFEQPRRDDLVRADSRDLMRSPGSSVRSLAQGTLQELLSDIICCDLPQLAAVRDVLAPRPFPPPGKGQPPRLPPRLDTGPPGPDMLSFPAPFVRVQRGDTNWELLPPALTFWEPLGLAPASGTKDVRTFCVYPSDASVEPVIGDFLDQLGASYESCKLGAYRRRLPDDQELDDYPHGMAIVHIDSEYTAESAFEAYADVCTELGTQLASIGQANSDSTIAVHIVNPFSECKAMHTLTACFWLLYKAYVEANKSEKGKSCSDLVLQILPISAIASPETLVVPDASFLSTLARELYDRCPPARSFDYTSPLTIVAAPAVELATTPPKRIHFALVSEPPRDLLHEGSILHLAYACSSDKEWVSVTWVDNSGRYSTAASFCLRGTSFASVAADIWERTWDIAAARQASWRIFIVAANDPASAEIHCWRSVITKPRPQAFNVTLLSSKTDNELQFFPPATVDAGQKEGLFAQTGFLTPATTPQASSFGVSPEASGQPNAPPTPAPSEPNANPENEPDAHLVDTADGSWGALLQRSKLPTENDNSLAIGVLIKRGDATKPGPLPCLTVSLQWTVQVRASAIDDGVGKRGEMTLKEVLGMYRNLSLLTKVRGLAESDEASVLPWHLCTAIRSARALNGFVG